MNIAFKIIMFSFMLNLSAGLLINVLPGMPVQYYSATAPFLDENSQDNQDIINAFEGDVSTGGAAEDSQTLIDRVLDKLIIGKVKSFVDGIKNFLFGVPVIIENIALQFIPKDNPQEYIDFVSYMTGTFITLMSVAYGFAIFFLFTNKRVNQ